MTEALGHARYGVQGGDIGGLVAARMGSLHPDAIIGIHLNFLLAQPPEEPGPEDEEAIARRTSFDATEFAYAQVQGTKPDSLTVAQSDSPAGLAAWILEKFQAWSAGDDVLATFSAEVLLTNLMFYWAPNSTPSAARSYAEAWRDPGGMFFPRVEVPTAVAVFPDEPWRVPRHWAEPRFDIRRWTEMPRGGHFAALEEPELLIAGRPRVLQLAALSARNSRGLMPWAARNIRLKCAPSGMPHRVAMARIVSPARPGSARSRRQRSSRARRIHSDTVQPSASNSRCR